MNTPSHAIINLGLLGRSPRRAFNLAIVLGGITPDIPIFIFYFWAKLVAKLPERQIWSEAYYQPFWQNVVATFHSIPLALIGLLLATSHRWQAGQFFCLSLVLHSLLDLPVHREDAHRHFFPFSNYRFISPVSYYDPAHYGTIAALIELLWVLGSTIYLIRWVKSPIGKGLMVLTNLVYIGGYFLFYASHLFTLNLFHV